MIRIQDPVSYLHVLGVDVELVDKEPEPGGVEVGAGAADAARREAWKLSGQVGEVVDGIGHHEQQHLRDVRRPGRHAIPQGNAPLE